jgi:hypothetical protein
MTWVHVSVGVPWQGPLTPQCHPLNFFFGKLQMFNFTQYAKKCENSPCWSSAGTLFRCAAPLLRFDATMFKNGKWTYIVTDLAAPGCWQPGLGYYRLRGFWAGDIFRKIEKVEKENQKRNKRKILLGKKPLKKGKKGSAEKANRMTSKKSTEH